MPSIYLISPPQINDINTFIYTLEDIFLLHDKPALFQLRLKNCTTKHIEDCMNKIIPICNKYGVKFIINDSITLAIKYNTGVHIGHDASVQDCIDFKHYSKKYIGVSCYNLIERAKLFENVVDYVSFGTMFPTQTKAESKICSPSIVQEYAQHHTSKEIAIIGGIDATNLEQITDILHLVSYICVISSVW